MVRSPRIQDGFAVPDAESPLVSHMPSRLYPQTSPPSIGTIDLIPTAAGTYIMNTGHLNPAAASHAPGNFCMFSPSPSTTNEAYRQLYDFRFVQMPPSGPTNFNQ